MTVTVGHDTSRTRKTLTAGGQSVSYYSIPAAEAAGLAGVAHGLTMVLSDPARRGQYLPSGMTVTAAIAHARRRLAEARALLPHLNAGVRPAFLSVGLTDLYLRRIERSPDQPLAVTQFRRQLTLWYHARRDSF